MLCEVPHRASSPIECQMQLALPVFVENLSTPFADRTRSDGIGWGNRKIKRNLSNFQPFYNSAIVIPELQGNEFDRTVMGSDRATWRDFNLLYSRQTREGLF